MKITHTYTKYLIIAILIFIVFSSIFYFGKNQKPDLTCATNITIENDKAPNKSITQFKLRMFFNKNGEGIVSFDGYYTDSQDNKKKIARYLKFNYTLHDGKLLITNSSLYRNINDDAPEHVISYTKTELTQISKISNGVIIMEATTPTFLCNLENY
ncbi:hypothetical protein B4923_17105 [Brenneria roseae subsp. americana]|uniref:Uncharacterized protein n=1 Tax=Brenneria roseae subsp. americana TaxID=1508507 RepID=A0A2U1TL75_9GAMM|nr:hypothetical protein [Brenneria roseae]PWC10153.1 hypothetical protein B4923_17105 [Brenneria roseae subsp. americana]